MSTAVGMLYIDNVYVNNDTIVTYIIHTHRSHRLQKVTAAAMDSRTRAAVNSNMVV